VAIPRGWYERLEIRVDRERLAFLAALLLLAGIGCLVAFDPRPRWPGWLALALAPSVLWRRQDPRPLLVLDDDGVWAPRTGLPPVAWEDVRRVHLQRVARATFLCIDIDRVDEYLARVSPWQSLLLTVSLRRLGDQLRLDLSFADRPAREIFDEVSRRCEAANPPSERPWH
jgi:hypothetical protein